MPSPFELNEAIGIKNHVCSKPGTHHSPSPSQGTAWDKSPQAQPHVSRKTTKATQTISDAAGSFGNSVDSRNSACQASLLLFKQREEVIPDRNIHPNLQLFPFIIQLTYVSSSDEAKLLLLPITNYSDIFTKSASLPSACWGSAGHSLHGRAFSGSCTSTDCTQTAIIPRVTYVVELLRPVLAGNTC